MKFFKYLFSKFFKFFQNIQKKFLWAFIYLKLLEKNFFFKSQNPEFVSYLDDISQHWDEVNIADNNYFATIFSNHKLDSSLNLKESPLINYDFSDFSVLLHFYGGYDFG